VGLYWGSESGYTDTARRGCTGAVKGAILTQPGGAVLTPPGGAVLTPPGGAVLGQ